MNVEENILISEDLTRASFCMLLDNRKENLYRLAFMYVKDQQDALDIVHEAIYKAYASFEKLKEPKYFNTWLTKIVINCALDHIRKSKKFTFFSNEHTYEPSYETNSDEIIDLYNALDKLNGNLKTVVILKYFEDLTIENIAEVLECSVSTVKNNLHKALKSLRVQLKEGDF